MTSYKVDEMVVYLKSNIIKVLTSGKREFEANLDYRDFLVCENNDDLYKFLDYQLKNNLIKFKFVKDKLETSVIIKIPPFDNKLITFKLSENKSKLTCTDVDIIQIKNLMNDFNNKLHLMNLKIKELEEKDNHIFLQGSKIGIPIETVKLNLIVTNYDYMISILSNPDSYICNINITNIKYLSNLEELIITKSSIDNDKWTINNFENIKYLSNLKKLVINDFNELKDLSFLLYLSKLEHLAFNDCVLDNVNIQQIQSLKQIKTLVDVYINE